MTISEPPGEHDRIRELIHRRRRQVIVHSVLYYRLDNPLVTDAFFDSLARELADLQNIHPEIAKEILYMRDAFRGFTGDTGFDLPLDDPAADAVAQRLLKYSREHTANLIR